MVRSRVSANFYILNMNPSNTSPTQHVHTSLFSPASTSTSSSRSLDVDSIPPVQEGQKNDDIYSQVSSEDRIHSQGSQPESSGKSSVGEWNTPTHSTGDPPPNEPPLPQTASNLEDDEDLRGPSLDNSNLPASSFQTGPISIGLDSLPLYGVESIKRSQPTSEDPMYYSKRIRTQGDESESNPTPRVIPIHTQPLIVHVDNRGYPSSLIPPIPMQEVDSINNHGNIASPISLIDTSDTSVSSTETIQGNPESSIPKDTEMEEETIKPSPQVPPSTKSNNTTSSKSNSSKKGGRNRTIESYFSPIRTESSAPSNGSVPAPDTATSKSSSPNPNEDIQMSTPAVDSSTPPESKNPPQVSESTENNESTSQPTPEVSSTPPPDASAVNPDLQNGFSGLPATQEQETQSNSVLNRFARSPKFNSRRLLSSSRREDSQSPLKSITGRDRLNGSPTRKLDVSKVLRELKARKRSTIHHTSTDSSSMETDSSSTDGEGHDKDTSEVSMNETSPTEVSALQSAVDPPMDPAPASVVDPPLDPTPAPTPPVEVPLEGSPSDTHPSPDHTPADLSFEDLSDEERTRAEQLRNEFPDASAQADLEFLADQQQLHNINNDTTPRSASELKAFLKQRLDVYKKHNVQSSGKASQYVEALIEDPEYSYDSLKENVLQFNIPQYLLPMNLSVYCGYQELSFRNDDIYELRMRGLPTKLDWPEPGPIIDCIYHIYYMSIFNNHIPKVSRCLTMYNAVSDLFPEVTVHSFRFFLFRYQRPLKMYIREKNYSDKTFNTNFPRKTRQTADEVFGDLLEYEHDSSNSDNAMMNSDSELRTSSFPDSTTTPLPPSNTANSDVVPPRQDIHGSENDISDVSMDESSNDSDSTTNTERSRRNPFLDYTGSSSSASSPAYYLDSDFSDEFHINKFNEPPRNIPTLEEKLGNRRSIQDKKRRERQCSPSKDVNPPRSGNPTESPTPPPVNQNTTQSVPEVNTTPDDKDVDMGDDSYDSELSTSSCELHSMVISDDVEMVDPYQSLKKKKKRNKKKKSQDTVPTESNKESSSTVPPPSETDSSKKNVVSENPSPPKENLVPPANLSPIPEIVSDSDVEMIDPPVPPEDKNDKDTSKAPPIIISDSTSTEGEVENVTLNDVEMIDPDQSISSNSEESKDSCKDPQVVNEDVEMGDPYDVYRNHLKKNRKKKKPVPSQNEDVDMSDPDDKKKSKKKKPKKNSPNSNPPSPKDSNPTSDNGVPPPSSTKSSESTPSKLQSPQTSPSCNIRNNSNSIPLPDSTTTESSSSEEQSQVPSSNAPDSRSENATNNSTPDPPTKSSDSDTDTDTAHSDAPSTDKDNNPTPDSNPAPAISSTDGSNGSDGSNVPKDSVPPDLPAPPEESSRSNPVPTFSAPASPAPASPPNPPSDPLPTNSVPSESASSPASPAPASPAPASPQSPPIFEHIPPIDISPPTTPDVCGPPSPHPSPRANARENASNVPLPPPSNRDSSNMNREATVPPTSEQDLPRYSYVNIPSEVYKSVKQGMVDEEKNFKTTYDPSKMQAIIENASHLTYSDGIKRRLPASVIDKLKKNDIRDRFNRFITMKLTPLITVFPIEDGDSKTPLSDEVLDAFNRTCEYVFDQIYNYLDKLSNVHKPRSNKRNRNSTRNTSNETNVVNIEGHNRVPGMADEANMSSYMPERIRLRPSKKNNSPSSNDDGIRDDNSNPFVNNRRRNDVQSRNYRRPSQRYQPNNSQSSDRSRNEAPSNSRRNQPVERNNNSHHGSHSRRSTNNNNNQSHPRLPRISPHNEINVRIKFFNKLQKVVTEIYKISKDIVKTLYCPDRNKRTIEFNTRVALWSGQMVILQGLQDDQMIYKL